MSAQLPIVTLDGPAGVGKSTLAIQIAATLKIPYLDTGAMFRCMALHLGDAVQTLNGEALRQRCKQWQFRLEFLGTQSRLFCNDVPVGSEIRTEEVGMRAAQLGILPEAREVLKLAQRHLGEHGALVAEGRDMGTVVFPEARFKFFLDASPEVRARRRLKDLEARGQKPVLEELIQQIRQRDELDRNRPVAPLCPAADALIVDTSDLDIVAVRTLLLQHIRHAGGEQLFPGMELC